MPRFLLLTFLVLVLLIGGGAGALAVADQGTHGEIAEGTSVSGVDVGGLTRTQALARVQREIGDRLDRPVRVTVGGDRYTLSAKRAGVRVDLEGAVERAYDVGRVGNFAYRGWRQLTNGRVEHDEPATPAADRKAIRAFVDRIEREQEKAPVDASIDLQITRVSVTESKSGRRLAGRDNLLRRVSRAVTSRSGARTFKARTVAVAPKVSTDDVFDAQPVAVTVSRDATTVRVFKRGELDKTYSVAVGSKEFPTPTGQFVVQTKQKNPTWNVPQSEWAGDLAGQTIPGGDPRNPLVARWIGFNGSVGFHGTKSAGSIGSAASHGCVRMNPSDVIDLYKRLEVGTPVLVA